MEKRNYTLVLVALMALLVGCSGAGGDTSSGPSVFCEDGQRDGDETDVDCGGSCGPCEVGRFCAFNADCSEGPCVPTAPHAEGAIGMCWGKSFGGCAEVEYDPSIVVDVCDSRTLVICQLAPSSAMQEHCVALQGQTVPSDVNFMCCNRAVFGM